MSKIIDLVVKHFGYGNGFSPNELSRYTDISQKVLSMVLKKYANTEIFHYTPSQDRFYLRTEEEVYAARINHNELVDKYDSRIKKYIL